MAPCKRSLLITPSLTLLQISLLHSYFCYLFFSTNLKKGVVSRAFLFRRTRSITLISLYKQTNSKNSDIINLFSPIPLPPSVRARACVSTSKEGVSDLSASSHTYMPKNDCIMSNLRLSSKGRWERRVLGVFEELGDVCTHVTPKRTAPCLLLRA